MGITLDMDKVICADVTSILQKINNNAKRPSFITFIPIDMAELLELKDGDQIQWFLMDDKTVHIVIKKRGT